MTTNRMFNQVQGQCRSMCIFLLLLHLNVDGNYLCVNRMFFQSKFKVAWGQAFAAHCSGHLKNGSAGFRFAASQVWTDSMFGIWKKLVQDLPSLQERCVVEKPLSVS